MKSFSYSEGTGTCMMGIISYNLPNNSIHVYSQLNCDKSYITDYRMYVNVVFSLLTGLPYAHIRTYLIFLG